jgi:hypothetical protein
MGSPAGRILSIVRVDLELLGAIPLCWAAHIYCWGRVTATAAIFPCWELYICCWVTYFSAGRRFLISGPILEWLSYPFFLLGDLLYYWPYSLCWDCILLWSCCCSCLSIFFLRVVYVTILPTVTGQNYLNKYQSLYGISLVVILILLWYFCSIWL